MPKARAKVAHSQGTPTADVPGRTAPGQSRLRTERSLWISVALAGLGALDSGYLAWIKLAHAQAFCSGVGDCEAVNSSIYSVINGVPVAVLGLVAYLVIGALFIAEARMPALRAYAPVAIFGLALTGTLYSAYLTYVELFVIHAICPYCVASAVIITSLLILSIVRLVRGPLPAADGH